MKLFPKFAVCLRPYLAGALATLAFLVSAVEVAKAAAPLPVGLGDFFRVQRVDDPRISPDAKQVAFVQVTPDIGTDRWVSTVKLVGTEEGAQVRSLPGQGDSFMPRWSPDGAYLAYLRVDAGGIQLVTLKTEDALMGRDASLRVVTSLAGGPIDFAWSPDGRRLAALVRLGTPLRQSRAVQAPEGATWTEPPLIYSSAGFQQVNDMLPKTANDFAVFVMSAEGGGSKRITQSGALGESLPYTKPDLVWMPDGKRVLVSLNLAEKGYLNAIQGSLFAIDAQSGVLQRLAGQDGGAYFNPSFARDGLLGFSCRAPTRNNLIRFEFCLQSATQPFKSVATSIEGMIYPAKLLPDGTGFIGVFGERGIGKLAVFGMDGSYQILAETGGGDANAYVDGGALTVSDNGTVAFLLSNGRVPSAVALARRGGSTRVLFDPNSAFVANRSISVAKEITYTPTDGAADVGAFLFPATTRSDTGKPPGIVMLHGGQSSDYGPDFDLVPQVFAAHGYHVVLPNYRGSGTYGRAFANMSTGAPIDREFDVIGAADALVASGADPDRIFLMGGSGGGMITGWTISRTKRFRAAVMWYPTTDWWSFAMDSAVGPTTLVSFRRAPWENPSEYIARSPYAQIGTIDTPTMVIIGDHDRITPLSGAMAFFRGLKVKGVEAELVVYPGAAHGIDAVPSQAMGHIAETLGWLERHGGNKVQMPVLPAVEKK
jgi:dipeptidyl aminopeptidase/acylaminoacyl peptidase